MKLIVGLGNPGAKHAGQRHNIGYMAVDRIAADHGFPPWRSKFRGSLSEGRLGGERVALLKPETFMNESGRSVGEAVRFFKLEPADVIVLHDELDLAPGRCKVKTGGGHAGHNGLRSIHAHIGPDHARVRLGIGHPGHKDRVSGYVLHDFARSDAEWLDDLMRGIADGAPALAEGDGARFMNAVSLRTSPPRSGTGAAPSKRPNAPKGAERARRADGEAPSGGAPDSTGSPDPSEARGGPSAGGDRARDPFPDGSASDAPLANAAPPSRDEGPEPERRSALQRLADRFR